MINLREIKDSVLHLLFPHVCSGCGSDNVSTANILCMRCWSSLPATNFEFYPDNPVEKKFWGRLPIQHAMAQYYFTRESLIQRLMHQFKYKRDKEVGRQLGKLMGDSIKKSERFPLDALIPLPLFPVKERRRGYNQATVLCEGMAESLGIPVLKDVVIRSQHTDTQTRKGRIERWQNMDGKFVLVKPEVVRNKKILLVDDVVTTGATLEACGAVLLEAENLQLSIAALCYAAKS